MSNGDFSLREIADVCLSGDDDIWVALSAVHTVTAGATFIVVFVVKCPPACLRPPTTTSVAIASVQHRVAAAVHVALTRTTACDQVASRSTKLGVNNEVQDEVDGEV